MKKIILMVVVCCIKKLAFAQTTDSIDNIILKIPAVWQIKKESNFTVLTLSDKKIKSFCQLAIYPQQPSTTNKQKDFEKEWTEVVEKNFTMLTLVKPVTMKNKNGNNFLRYGAKGIGGDGNKYFIELNVYDCGASIQSVMAVSGSKEYLAQYDSLWQGLIRVKKQSVLIASTTKAGKQEFETEKKPQTTTTNSIGDKRIIGKWAKSSSSPPQYQNGVLVNMVNAGYQKGQYDFKADGTYTFHGESKYNTNFNLTDETGNYTMTGSQFILMPSSGTLRQVDFNGVLKKSETLSLAKRVYNWQIHYFEGINETNLVLSAVAENIVDGGYGGNSLFPNAFLYSQKFIPEWRFNP